MNQTLSNKEEPLFQLLDVEPERDRHDTKRRCPFIGLSNDTDTVMAFPSQRNHCHWVKSAQPVRIEYQSTHCLTFTHRHCPVLLKKPARTLPVDIAQGSKKKKSTAMAISFAVVFILMTIGLLFFSGWQWTSASDWFASPDSAPAQQEVIEAPDQQPLNPAEATPSVRPTEALPSTELLLNQALPAVGAPEPTPTSVPSSETQIITVINP